MKRLLVALLFAFGAGAQTQYLGAGGSSGGAGEGTVTSVGIAAPAQISVSGSPVTGAGTITLSWASAAQGTIFAGPCSGAGTPVFRALCAADVPALDPTKITGTAVITSDARLSDARTPTAHASTHASAGSDPVTLAQSQVTNLTTDLAAKVPTTRTITAGLNLTGGGDLSANRTIALATDISGLTSVESDAFAGDLTGNVTGNVTGTSGSTTGNAATATALATNPTDCAGGEFAHSIDASGNLDCDPAGGASLPVVDTTSVVEGSADATKEMRIEIDGIATATTIVMTPPTTSFTAARTDAAQTFTGNQTINGSVIAEGATLSNNTFVTGGRLRVDGYLALGNGDDTSLDNIAAGVVGVGVGVDGSVAGSIRSTWVEQVVGANVASATTITLTGGIQHVTGTTAIATINLPRVGFTGCVKLIPDAVWTLTTGGNVAIAATAVVNRVMEVCYDGSAWVPSYL